MYDSKCGKIFYSRDVQFNELECGVEKESNERDEKRYIELEFPSDDEMLPDTPVEPVPCRSERERRPPLHFGEWANITSIREPQTFSQAIDSPEKITLDGCNKKKKEIGLRSEKECLHRP